MITEPQRSQYLDAMGLTAWVSRYRLPNAAETQECEWFEPEVAPERPPAQRLHALLEGGETPQNPPAAAKAESATPPPRPQKRARGLLESEGVVDAEQDAPSEAAPSPAAVEPRVAPQASLRFKLQVAALEGRWLVLLPAGRMPERLELQLLNNLLQAAGIVLGESPSFQAFSWPMVEGLPVESPLDEAREGLGAFIEGQARRGWRLERVLVFGNDETLASVLAINEGHCSLLGIRGWQGPSLDELSRYSSAKRELWRSLVEWRKAWHRVEDDDDDLSPSDGRTVDS